MLLAGAAQFAQRAISVKLDGCAADRLSWLRAAEGALACDFHAIAAGSLKIAVTAMDHKRDVPFLEPLA